MLMLAAGMDTTANTLVQGTFYVLHNDRIHRKLCDELFKAMPDKDVMINSATLENLPYLVRQPARRNTRLTDLTYQQRAVIKESLRFSYGAPGRLPRVVPASGATLCGEFIPPGVRLLCSMSVTRSGTLILPTDSHFAKPLRLPQ